MEAEARLATLSEKHANLERAIEEESQRPMPDTLRVTKLKREKLRIKEEISRLQDA